MKQREDEERYERERQRKLEKCEEIRRELSSKEDEKSRKECELRSLEGEKQAVHWLDPDHDRITADIDSRIRSLEGDISSLDSDIRSLESDYNSAGY